MSELFRMQVDQQRDEEGRDLDAAFFEVEDESDALQDLPWQAGEPLTGRVTAPIRVRIEDQGEVYADYQGGSIPLVSERLKEAIEAVGSRGVELFAVEVTNAEADTPKYFALNCCVRAKAQVVGDRLQLEAGSLEGVSVFRYSLAPGFLNVSAALKAELERAGVTTLQFKDLAAPVATGDGD